MNKKNKSLKDLLQEEFADMMKEGMFQSLAETVEDFTNREVGKTPQDPADGAHVIGSRATVPDNIFKPDEPLNTPIRYKRSEFRKQGKGEEGYEKITDGLNLDDMQRIREEKAKKMSKEWKEQYKEIKEKYKEDIEAADNARLQLLKNIRNTIKIETKPTSEVIMRVGGHDNIKKLQLNKAKLGDLFAFKLIEIEDVDGTITYDFSLVKI